MLGIIWPDVVHLRDDGLFACIIRSSKFGSYHLCAATTRDMTISPEIEGRLSFASVAQDAEDHLRKFLANSGDLPIAFFKDEAVEAFTLAEAGETDRAFWKAAKSGFVFRSYGGRICVGTPDGVAIKYQETMRRVLHLFSLTTSIWNPC